MKKLFGSVLIISSLLIFSVPVADAKTKTPSYGPTALCRDGTYSYSSNHRGTCSWHKGVKVWYK